MPNLTLVRDTDPHRSSLRRFSDRVTFARTDLSDAFDKLPLEVQQLLRPRFSDLLTNLNALEEGSLVAGYRAGLVDFYEDERTEPTT